MATVRYADPEAVAAAVLSMPPGHVHCRNYGHVWAHRSVTRVPGGYAQTLGCQSCGTEKYQLINASGDIVSSSMSYAQGYLLKGLGRLSAHSRSTVRVASLEAFLADSKEIS